MKLTYDPKHNIAYISLKKKRGKVRTVSVSDELNVDLAPDGSIYGIELLNANEQLQASDDGTLIVVNESQLPLFRRPPHRENDGRRFPFSNGDLLALAKIDGHVGSRDIA